VVTDSYLHSMMMAGIVAAHETTANGIANAGKLLMEHRVIWDQICADPSPIPNAGEECLRPNGSQAASRRITTKPTERGRVPGPYLHSLMLAGIVAAHETTANGIANAVKPLMAHRVIWDQICADPSLIPNAVEECLRHNGSQAAWRRITTKPTEIGGVPVPE